MSADQMRQMARAMDKQAADGTGAVRVMVPPAATKPAAAADVEIVEEGEDDDDGITAE